MKFFVGSASLFGIVLAVEDPKLFKQLAKSAKEIDLAEDSEKREHVWCKDAAHFLQDTLDFTADLKSSVINDSKVLEDDRVQQNFDHSFLAFLEGVLHADANVVDSLQDVSGRLKDVGGQVLKLDKSFIFDSFISINTFFLHFVFIKI